MNKAKKYKKIKKYQNKMKKTVIYKKLNCRKIINYKLFNYKIEMIM